MRKNFFLAYDVSIMALAPFIALFIRNDYNLKSNMVADITPYALTCVVISAFVFWALKTNKILWCYTSLHDFLRIMVAITATILLSLVFSFIFSRLDGVARSIPFIQGAFAVAVIIGSRLLIRTQLRTPKQTSKQKPSTDFTPRKHVLVVGLSVVTDLYLRCVSDLGKDTIIIEGILNEKNTTKGRLLSGHKVIGSPEDLPAILAQYNIHGIEITEIVITTPFDQLSKFSQAQLLHWEKSGDVILDLFEERLGFGQPKNLEQKALTHNQKTVNTKFEKEKFCHNGYLPIKRVFDVVASIALMIICSPLMLITALLVAIDLKLPLIFWQQRPGLLGKPFKIYKFRTMAAAHDKHGRRIPDNKRLSKIGKFLRKTRLDELPQLYHVFIGEMSFVGPRPLLPVDIPEHGKVRLNIRPGITGWAQINGGHSVPANEKMALDIWYMNNVSLWLDIKIMIQTVHVAISGEKINKAAIIMAEQEFKKAITLSDANQDIKQAA